MNKNKFKLRNVVAIAICLAGTTFFVGCDKEKDPDVILLKVTEKSLYHESEYQIEATSNSKALDDSVRELMQITGQKPVVTRAKKSIASFKLREGAAIGCKVTLRGVRMYEFLDKLFNIALPRVRDFRGVSKNAFDGRGNYTLGVKEQLIFPEIDYDRVSKIRGMDIVIVTTANTDEEARELLTQFGMPFQK